MPTLSLSLALTPTPTRITQTPTPTPTPPTQQHQYQLFCQAPSPDTYTQQDKQQQQQQQQQHFTTASTAAAASQHQQPYIMEHAAQPPRRPHRPTAVTLPLLPHCPLSLHHHRFFPGRRPHGRYLLGKKRLNLLSKQAFTRQIDQIDHVQII